MDRPSGLRWKIATPRAWVSTGGVSSSPDMDVTKLRLVAWPGLDALPWALAVAAAVLAIIPMTKKGISKSANNRKYLMMSSWYVVYRDWTSPFGSACCSVVVGTHHLRIGSAGRARIRLHERPGEDQGNAGCV